MNEHANPERIAQRFHCLLSATGALSYSFDVPSFRTTFISDNVLSVLGWAPQQFLKDRDFFFSLVHPDDLERVPQTAAELRTGDSQQLEYRLRDSRGEYRWMRHNLHVMCGPDGSPCECVGVMVDITDRKVAEEKAAANERQIRTVLNTSAAFHAVMDLEGRMLDINEAPLLATKQTRENVIGKHLWETYGWSYSEYERQRVRAMFLRAVNGETVSEDLDILTNDDQMLTIEARMVPLYEGDRVVQVIGSAIDVTQRKQVERALRASKQRLRLLLETATLTASTLDMKHLLESLMQRFGELIPHATVGAIYLYDDQRYDLYAAACRGCDIEAFQRLRLLPEEGIVGRVFQTEESIRVTTPEQVRQARQTLRPQNQELYARVRGPQEIISVIATPLKAPGGAPLGVVTVSSTTTQLTPEDLALLQGVAAFTAMAVQNARSFQHEKDHAVKLEQTVAHRTAELRKANLELESFVHTVAHDLRAPLRAMHGFARALEEDFSRVLEDHGRQYTQQIIDAAQRMDRLIQDLLTYSRVGRAELRLGPVSAEEAVEEARRLVSSEYPQRDIQYEVGPLPIVQASASILVQLFANLLSNAVKFVPADRKPRIQVFAETHASSCRIWVVDNGIGIAPEHQQRIFRVFERLHGIEEYPGTGIGLAIVARACHALGGAYGVASEPGSGSRFWVELPQGTKR